MSPSTSRLEAQHILRRAAGQVYLKQNLSFGLGVNAIENVL